MKLFTYSHTVLSYVSLISAIMAKAVTLAILHQALTSSHLNPGWRGMKKWNGTQGLSTMAATVKTDRVCGSISALINNSPRSVSQRNATRYWRTLTKTIQGRKLCPGTGRPSVTFMFSKIWLNWSKIHLGIHGGRQGWTRSRIRSSFR